MVLLIGWYGVRGLASPHPFLGAICWLVLLVMMHLVLFFRRSCWCSKLWRLRSCSSSAWSVSFLSFRICCLSWSRLLVRPLRFLSCLYPGGQCPCYAGCARPRVRRGEDSCSLSCSSLRRRRCRLVATVFLPMMLMILRGTALCRRREIHYQFLPVPRRCWCVAMSSGGESSPDDAYDSAWDSVMLTKGNTLSITSSFKRSLGVYAC